MSAFIINNSDLPNSGYYKRKLKQQIVIAQK